MKSITNCILFACFTLISISSVYAQTDTVPVYFSPPGVLKGCHSNIFVIDSMYVDTTTTLSIQFQIRDSVGIADTSCTGITPIIVSLMGLNPLITSSSYDPDSAIWSCVLAPGNISFSLSVSIDCSILQIGGSGQVSLSSVQLWQQWTSTSNDFYSLNNSGLNEITSGNILSPWLVDESSTSFQTAYGLYPDILFKYKNNGESANVRFYFDTNDSDSCDAYEEISLEYGIADSSGVLVAPYDPYINQTWITEFLPKYHSIQIRRNIRIIDCLSLCNNEKGIFKWRCEPVPGADTLFCDACQQVFQKSFTVLDDPNQRAVLQIVRISPDSATVSSDFSCPGVPVQWTYRVRNIGAGTAAIANIGIANNSPNSLAGYSYLTDISNASFSFDTTGCTNCSVNVIDSFKVAPSFCSIDSALWSKKIVIHEFAGGDSVDFSFSTLRCCEEADAELMNRYKFFNHWQAYALGSDSCNSITSIPSIPFPISLQSINSSQDLHLELSFLPMTSDLSVPQDPTGPPSFGDSTTMEVNFHGMFIQGLDYQILGCNADTNCFMKGFLRARINTQLGLHIDNYNSIFFHSDTIGDWFPEFYYTDKDTAQCEIGNYYFYFDLSDSLARDMIQAGNLKFTLRSCCSGVDVAQSQYTISFHLLMNPDTCVTLVPPVNLLTPPVCIDCCWLPLSERGDEIAVHCPGCLYPGIIVDDYKMERLNYGVQDDDNNMIADEINQIIKDDAYYDSHPNIRSNFSMHGDQLWDVLDAHFETGGNYTYFQMADTPGTATLNYLQLFREIGRSDTSQMNLVVRDFDLYIDVPDSAGGCLDCEEQEIADTLYRTIQQNHISNDSLASYLTIIDSTSTYFFTFGIDTVNNDNLYRNIVFPLTPSTFTQFVEEQRYRLVVRYDVCGNWESGGTEYYKQSTIFNKMWLTGTQLPWNTNLQKPPDFVLFPVAQALADTNIFYCETYGGRHFFVSNEFFNYSVVNNYGCGNPLGVVAMTRIGGTYTGDIFPSEVRVPAYKPNSYMVSLPSGLSLSNAYMQSLHHTTTGWASSPVNFNITPAFGNTYLFTDTLYASPQCFTDTTTLPLDNSFYSFDQYSRLYFGFNIEMDSCMEDFVIKSDTIALIDFTDNTNGCITNPVTLCGHDTLTVKSGDIIIRQPNPNLNLQIELLTVQASQNEVCWKITINNPIDTSLIYPLITTAANNVYLNAPDTGIYDYLTNWHFHLNNGLIETFPDTNGIIHITDSLPLNATITGKVCANFRYCPEEVTFDSLDFNWGWNCDDYPIPDSIVSCFEDTSRIVVHITDFGITTAVDKFRPDSVYLCDTIYFGTYFSPAGVSFIYPEVIYLDDLPVGLQITEAYIINPADTDSLLLPPTFPYWYITDSMMIDIGFPTGGLNNPDQLQVSYFAVPSCNYDGTLPKHKMRYHNYCYSPGDVTIPNNDTINILGSHCNDCFTIEKTALQDSASVGDTVTFEIVVCGNNLFADTVIVHDFIPENFTPTTSIIDSLIIPPTGCDTFYVSGFYTVSGFCGDSGMFNLATVYFGTDSISDTSCVEIYPSCSLTADTIIADSSFATSYPLGFTGIDIYVHGRFYVDTANFTVQNCNIFVNSGGQIIVLPNASLTIDSSIVEGCDNMWAGMFLDATAGLLVRKHSIVRDAHWAINSRSKTSIALLHSSFEDNVHGLYVPPDPGGNFFIKFGIYGCRFGLFGAGLKPDYSSQYPHGLMPYSGVELNDMIAWTPIGVANQDSNWFFNMNSGVLGFRSQLRVLNNKFEDIQSDTSLSFSPWNGAAVGSIGLLNQVASSLEVKPVNSHAWSMKNCRTGVYTYFSSLTADSLRMTGMRAGVVSRRCPRTSSVSYCHIEARRFGIDWRLNAGAISMYAGRNEILIQGNPLGIGINLEETTMGDPNYLIEGNSNISITSAMAGIRSRGVFDPQIIDNIINQHSSGSTPLTYGILMEKNDTGLVQCNKVISSDITNTSTYGMELRSTTRTLISCNEVDSNQVGFHFQGISPLYLSANVMRNNFWGLEVDSLGALIDIQPHRGNQWFNYRDTVGAVHWDFSGSVWPLSEFQTSGGFLSSYWPQTPAWTTGWFTPLAGTEDRCGHTCDVHELGPDTSRGGDGVRRSIAQDSLDATEENTVVAKQFLFDQLKEDQVLLQSDIVFEDFYNENTNGLIGKINEVSLSLKNIQQPNLTYYDSLNELDSIWNYNLTQMQDLDELIEENPTIDYSEQKVELADQILISKSDLDNLIREQFESGLSEVVTASGTNNTITPDQLPQTNEKFINQMNFYLIENGVDFLLDYYNSILDIAYQCPSLGGPAVFTARTLINLLDDSIDFADVCNDSPALRNQIKSNISETISDIKITPNPADEKIDIVLSNDLEGICKIEISNAFGALVYSEIRDCKEKQFSIKTTNLKPAIYSVKVLAGDAKAQVAKLVIAR